jgi:hypothetical protein
VFIVRITCITKTHCESEIRVLLCSNLLVRTVITYNKLNMVTILKRFPWETENCEHFHFRPGITIMRSVLKMDTGLLHNIKKTLRRSCYSHNLNFIPNEAEVLKN